MCGFFFNFTIKRLAFVEVRNSPCFGKYESLVPQLILLNNAYRRLPWYLLSKCKLSLYHILSIKTLIDTLCLRNHTCLIVLIQLLICGLDIIDSLRLKSYSMLYTYAYSAYYYCLQLLFISFWTSLSSVRNEASCCLGVTFGFLEFTLPTKVQIKCFFII